MTLLTPLALALSAVAVPVILLYVLKLRRREHVVSSTLLWRRALDDVQANAPWQRLRFNILLLLQLLALMALVLALAGPAYSQTHAFEGDLVLIIDQSYGMQAHDVRPTRFAAALAQAHTLTADLGSGNVASVIGMGAHPRLAIAESDDQGAIDRAIDSLPVGVAPPNFLEAFSLAASLGRSGQKTRVVVLTSRDSGITRLPLPVSFPVDIVRIGRHLRDLAITAFQASRVGTTTEALLRVSNFGSGTARSDIDLYVDGRLADVRPLSVGAGRQETVFWSNLPATVQQMQAKLTRRDDVTADKSAWTVIPAAGTRRVLLVTKSDYFLQTALSLDPSVRLSTVSPAAYSPPVAQRYDLLVFDGTLPPQLPQSPVLLVAPPAGTVGSLHFGAALSLAGNSLAASPAGSSSPLLQYVDLSDVHVAAARQATLPGWLQSMVTAAGVPLLAAGDNGTRRLAVVTFNLQQSDWPLRISFPIAMQNLLRYLTPGVTLGAANLIAGQQVKLEPPAGSSEIQVRQPDGAVTVLHPPFPPYAATELPGLYRVRVIGRQHVSDVPFAVNFFPTRAAAASGPKVLHYGQASGGTTRVVGVPVSIAWAFGLAALAVLGAEWWFALRR
jgi:Ca-activated chloride channel family protein